MKFFITTAVLLLPFLSSAEEEDKLKLSQNYPNPFWPTTTITVEVPTEQNLTISIYNVLGELVGVVYDSLFVGKGDFTIDKLKKIIYVPPKTPETTIVNFNKFDQGIYFYKAETKDTSIVKKMLLLK